MSERKSAHRVCTPERHSTNELSSEQCSSLDRVTKPGKPWYRMSEVERSSAPSSTAIVARSQALVSFDAGLMSGCFTSARECLTLTPLCFLSLVAAASRVDLHPSGQSPASTSLLLLFVVKLHADGSCGSTASSPPSIRLNGPPGSGAFCPRQSTWYRAMSNFRNLTADQKDDAAACRNDGCVRHPRATLGYLAKVRQKSSSQQPDQTRP